MKEKDFDDSTLDFVETNKSTVVESNILNMHEEKMGKMLENSQNIVKRIKPLPYIDPNYVKSMFDIISLDAVNAGEEDNNVW